MTGAIQKTKPRTRPDISPPVTIHARQEKGRWGEKLAVKILHDQDYLVLERNWRCRFGEIDLVAWDKQNRILAFVEVKSRYSDQFGGARWAINAQKYRRLRALVGCWLAYPHSDQKISGYKQQATTIRLDLIAIDIPQSGPVKVTFTKGI